MPLDPLENRTVSRKTPGDGKLEVSRPVAQKLERVGTGLEIRTPAGNGTVELTSMPCTCRGENSPHEHWFLASPLLRSLVPGTEVALALDGQTVVVTETARPTD